MPRATRSSTRTWTWNAISSSTSALTLVRQNRRYRLQGASVICWLGELQLIGRGDAEDAESCKPIVGFSAFSASLWQSVAVGRYARTGSVAVRTADTARAKSVHSDEFALSAARPCGV